WEDNSGAKPATVPELLDLLTRLHLHEPAPAGAEMAPLADKTSADGAAKTLIVSPSGAADYSSIEAAGRAAAPGSRILVRPGRYSEGIVLNKELEIVGDGPVQDIVVESHDFHCVSMQTDRALVRGLTLRSLGACKGNQRCAIDVPRGRLTIEDCDLTSDTLAGISIHGPATEPTVRRCRIHSGGTSGVVVWDKGRGTIEDCEIFGNALTGVLIRTAGNPVVRSCRIRDGKMFGVMVEERGAGTIEECDISGNVVAGVQCLSGGNAVIRKSKIRDGKKAGILAVMDGAGVV